MFLKFYFLAFI